MRVKRKLQFGTFGLLAIGIFSFFLNNVLFLCFIVLCLLFFLASFSFLLLNKKIKTTNRYKNNFIYTGQFVSNAGYRKNTQRNYEVVNVGSFSARFAFSYEGVSGQNWSTGLQGLNKDLDILKYYHSYIKKGGIVLLPVVPFSSVSGYLKPEKDPLPFVAKFVSILDSHQINTMPKGIQARLWINYPLLYTWKSIRWLFRDEEEDNTLAISEQKMQTDALNKDASSWMELWKKNFNIADLNAPLSGNLKEGREKSISDLRNLIDFCLERSLKPVLILPPVSKYLSRLFSETTRETYIYSFIREVNIKNITFLDYFDNERFSDESLYFNSFFLHLKGRKLFTQQVLKDLNLSNLYNSNTGK